MLSITIGVEPRTASSSRTATSASLTLDDAGVGYDPGEGEPQSWAWAGVRLEFEPSSEPGERGLVASLLGAVGFSNSKSNVPVLRLTADGADAADGVEVAFELPNVEGDLAVVASRIVAQFPAAAGRVSVRDRAVGT